MLYGAPVLTMAETEETEAEEDLAPMLIKIREML